MARCIHCDRKLDILIGIDLLANHLHMFHDINENSRNGNKIVKNNVDILPSLKRSWAWQHYTSISKSEIKCNHCNKIYKGLHITSNRKQHLYNFHKISNNNEWKNFKTTHNLVWQYFTKEEGYTAKCTICNQLIKSASHVTCLKSHLTSKHKQEVINIQETIKRAWLIRHFAINNDSHTIKCIHCKRKLTIFLGINGLENHLLTFHGINDSTQTERQNEENGADIMMPQLVNDKSSANASSHQNDCAQAMENKKRQRLYYESIQDQPIMQMNTLEQMLRSDKTLNNDNLTADALISQDISKCLKPDEETGRNIVSLRMQYMTNESNIASSKVYQEVYLRDTSSEEDRWFHYRVVWNQQTMTSASQQTLQTHNATNIEVCPYGYLAFSDTNRYSKSDEETRRTANMAVQFSVNGKNNTCSYQENSHLPIIGNERSQWLYYKAIEDLQTFMLKSSKQVIAHQLISNTSNHYHFPDTFTFHNIYEYSRSQTSIRENPTNIFFST
ncbi:uncharacterized protein LOC105423664 [Pogonomyrmex barbatus]|uniref:Uncharacterized protein LOC105423664 n=1 Tax=Pogonomyrmex barbatus TaxID=144034 RepID=A0A6I9VUR4_9HYME|nr:uncharacterized protein LOC105423664 [Pogonomyrmex barbatus]